MGTIVKRKNKNAEVYTVRVRLKNLPEITATFKELKEAERFIFEKEIWLTKDPLNYSKLGRKYLLKDLIKKFTAERLPILKASEEYRRILFWWSEQIGEIDIKDISPSTIDHLRNYLLRNRRISKSRVNRYTAVLSSLFSISVREWQLMESNPCSKIKKFKEPEGRTRYLSNEERRRLLDACKMSRNKDLLLVVELAISSGMRKNEILTIRIRQIDFDNGWINIYETKNDNKRIIPISAALLKKFQMKIDREKLVADDFLFHSERDRARPRCIRVAFTNALKIAKVEDFRFHDLRHTTASYLAMSGVPIQTISRILGHKTILMTMRYTHLDSAHLREAIQKISTVIVVEDIS